MAEWGSCRRSAARESGRSLGEAREFALISASAASHILTLSSAHPPSQSPANCARPVRRHEADLDRDAFRLHGIQHLIVLSSLRRPIFSSLLSHKVGQAQTFPYLRVVCPLSTSRQSSTSAAYCPTLDPPLPAPSFFLHPTAAHHGSRAQREGEASARRHYL